jgi:hypothetical protein
MQFCDRRFHRVLLVFAIALGYATLAATPSAFGSPAADGNLLEMLQYSTGIAIVEVADCKPFDPLYPGINFKPQQSATCKLREVIAGAPPNTIRVAIYSSDVKAGDLALAFIGRRPKDTVDEKQGHHYLFSMSDGFRLLSKLVYSGKEDDNAAALAAIKEAAKVIKPPSANVPDEGLMPFVRLLKGRNPRLRSWAFSVLMLAPTSPFIERTLVSCLEMDDSTVSSGAAYDIIYRRLELTDELERFLARRQWEALPLAIPRLLKRMAVGPPDPRDSVEFRVRNYLLAVKIQRCLRKLPEADTERLWQGVAPLLTERQPWHSVARPAHTNSWLQKGLASGILRSSRSSGGAWRR